MKVVTILGTRPEIIRLSLVVPKLDALCDHVLVHTGQNYDPRLNDIFFDQLGLRPPNINMGIKSNSFGDQAGQILRKSDEVLEMVKPDRVLILGDTNSGLASIVAKRKRIQVFHMEAGNRCFDDRVPEEVNRRIIDQCSDILMPYTNRSREYLLKEGRHSSQIFVTGNPIYEVLAHHEPRIAQNHRVLEALSLKRKGYFLVTIHRAENVDVPERLATIISGIRKAVEVRGLPAFFSVHPRTRDKIRTFGVDDSGLIMSEPLGFFDFVALEKNAACVLTDSGTVQEECCILGTPTVTVRDATERPETIEVGSNILSGASMISDALSVALTPRHWTMPDGYAVPNVSSVVTGIVLGFGGSKNA